MLIGNKMIKPVIIIGGGLAGLYSAYQLQLLNAPYLLLEAKSQLGGRIYSAQSPINSGVSFDLGLHGYFLTSQKFKR